MGSAHEGPPQRDCYVNVFATPWLLTRSIPVACISGTTVARCMPQPMQEIAGLLSCAIFQPLLSLRYKRCHDSVGASGTFADAAGVTAR